jgi:dihydroflavonol-4-reductase
MKAVVTGATGHLGINLVSELVRQGHQVEALVRGARRVGVFADSSGLKQTICDLRDEDALSRILPGVDVVFHVAGKISVDGDRRGDVWETNVVATAHLVRAAKAASVTRLVHVSSIQAHDDRARPSEVVDETFPLWTEASDCPAYSFSKAAAERVVESARETGLSVVVVRPTAVFGAMDLRPSPLGRVLQQIGRGQLLALTSGGFDFVDVRDVVQAMVAAALRPDVAPAYLLGGRYLTLVELAEATAKVSGAPPPTFEVPLSWAGRFVPFASWLSRATGNAPSFTRESLRALERGRRIDIGLAQRDLDYRPRPLSPR